MKQNMFTTYLSVKLCFIIILHVQQEEKKKTSCAILRSHFTFFLPSGRMGPTTSVRLSQMLLHCGIVWPLQLLQANTDTSGHVSSISTCKRTQKVVLDI